jgi:hypothetical protein
MSEDFSGLTLVELLDLLEPVPEPLPVSLWPQTAGWIWLGIVVAAAVGWGARRWLVVRRANAYRRIALQEVAAADGEFMVLAAILRRTALAGYPRADVAGLYGEDWLAFLDETYGGTGFRDGPGRAFATAPYARSQVARDLAPLVVEWLRRHRVSADAAP